MAFKTDWNYSEHDISLLIARAKALCFPPEFPSTADADWLLEGALGTTRWVTRKSGAEYFDTDWRNTCNVNFDLLLPDKTLLTEPSHRICFGVLQKWSFAWRSGWLGSDPSPLYWKQSTYWSLNFTSWIYLRQEEFYPDELGYSNVDADDLLGLFEELTIDGWVTALRVIERTFDVLHQLAYGCAPPEFLKLQLPEVPPDVVKTISAAIEQHGLLVQHQSRGRPIISRAYLSAEVAITGGFFLNDSVRKFLWKFEGGQGNSSVIVSGRTANNCPRASTQIVVDDEPVLSRSHTTMLRHSSFCMAFLKGKAIRGINIPDINFSTKSLKELMPKWVAPNHRHLIDIDHNLVLLNEAACWITEYGDEVINLYQDYMEFRRVEGERLASLGYRDEWINISLGRKFSVFRDALLEKEQASGHKHGVVSSLGLTRVIFKNPRSICRGNISLMQAVFALVGACAYAIGMMKPMRDGELAGIRYDCVTIHNKTNGCWAKFPVEKSEKQGQKKTVTRPIPYLTYLAIRLMQRFARFSADYWCESEMPSRLFYFPSEAGYSPPVRAKVSLSINRCMDIFCDYVDLPTSDSGTRYYFRTHEMRKFFLLMLTWDDPLHGWEAGAWMAVHKDPDHMQAYTEANINGAEITAWEAEQVEIKLLALDFDTAAAGKTSQQNQHDDLLALYETVKREFDVEKISTLPRAKFESYVKNALLAKRYVVKLMALKSKDSTKSYDFGVFIKDAKSG